MALQSADDNIKYEGIWWDVVWETEKAKKHIAKASESVSANEWRRRRVKTLISTSQPGMGIVELNVPLDTV